MKVTHQEELLQLIGYSNIKPKKRVDNTSDVTKSRWIFAVTMIILIVGLTLDFDFQNSIVTNTLTIISFAVIFFTMGNAAKEAFAEFLDEAYLDSNQIYFVNQIVEYIVHNGLMKDLSVLQDAPFTDNGSIVEVFTDLTLWMGIKRVIDKINANAAA